MPMQATNLVSYTELVACPKGTHTTECSPNKSVKNRYNERSDWSINRHEYRVDLLLNFDLYELNNKTE